MDCIKCLRPIGENNTYGNSVSICRDCHNRGVLQRGQDNKAYARKLLGDKCARCPMAHPAALAIHHKDPSLKDPGFKNVRYWSRKRIQRELVTCELLCHNCHFIEHAEDEYRAFGAKKVKKNQGASSQRDANPLINLVTPA